jgi:hypothetical protein
MSALAPRMSAPLARERAPLTNDDEFQHTTAHREAPRFSRLTLSRAVLSRVATAPVRRHRPVSRCAWRSSGINLCPCPRRLLSAAREPSPPISNP